MEKTYPQFLHHGAADGVTGSCHRYIASDELHLLVDCGLFQGVEAFADGKIKHDIEFDISRVRALIVTHVHIDHVGRIPYLLAAGFKGPIFCSIPSAKLLPLVIEDALKVGFTRDSRIVQNFLETVQSQLMPLKYQAWYVMVNQYLLKLKIRLQRAGHILGSAYVELDLQYRTSVDEPWVSHRTVFSGDLGAPHAPLLPAPKPPYAADTLVIESTYGNRVHASRKERRLRLKSLVESAMRDGGTVLIPAFSIGRTQELLYELESIIHDVTHATKTPHDSKKTNTVGAGLPANNPKRHADPTIKTENLRRQAGSYRGEVDFSNFDWAELQIIVDSPLAAKFTKVYKELKPFWDDEALQRVRSGRHPLDFENLLTVDSHEDHMRVVHYLAETKRPAIVLAASGMAAGGRIVNYLKAMLDDPRHNLLFVGYQANGTPGHDILKYAGAHESHTKNLRGQARSYMELPWVELDGERYSIRAGVTSIGGYSAHADQHNLLTFVRGMRRWPKQIRIVHGTDESRPALGEKYKMMAREAGKEVEIVLPNRATPQKLPM